MMRAGLKAYPGGGGNPLHRQSTIIAPARTVRSNYRRDLPIGSAFRRVPLPLRSGTGVRPCSVRWSARVDRRTRDLADSLQREFRLSRGCCSVRRAESGHIRRARRWASGPSRGPVAHGTRKPAHLSRPVCLIRLGCGWGRRRGRQNTARPRRRCARDTAVRDSRAWPSRQRQTARRDAIREIRWRHNGRSIRQMRSGPRLVSTLRV